MAVDSYGGADEGGYAQLDLSGKLIIKAQLGDDIRRIPIHNEEITYDELVLMMQRVFRGKLDASDEVLIKYRDEDGDLVSIFDSSDLSFAIQCSRILKLTIFVNGQPEPLQSDEVKHIKTELQKIRNQVIHLIDQLEPRTSSPGDPAEGDKGSANVTIANTTNAVAPKEFDPLSAKEGVERGPNKVVSSFGLQEDGRGGSPDSISSQLSSASQKQPQQQMQGGPPSSSLYQQGPPQSQQQQVYAPGQNIPGGVPQHHYFQGQGGPHQQQQQQQSSQPQSPASSVGSSGGFAPPPPGSYGQGQPGQGYGGYQQNPQMQQGQYGQPQPSQQPQHPQQVRGSPFSGSPSGGPPNQGPTNAPANYPGGPPTSQAYLGQMQQQYPAGYPPGNVGPGGPVPSGGSNPYSRGPSSGYPRPALNHQTGY
ncbi:hypothetical protein JTE90_008431 [Oedothorax gibbosus]|uniref:PB1 domain-containing protein n=1 Tax=Oedothorax gibbosus TaxID=931172 RepID=A0AAV6UTL3_9ARAC|nr:hypothetical protein JTE90_008431 [Oedothorax gibbosus]